jgi:HDOD domain
MRGLTEPLKDLNAWVRFFATADIPVFAHTAAALETLRPADEELSEALSPAQLGAVVDADPLMTVKLMAHVASRKRRQDDSALPETVLSMIVLTGVAPFFRQFGPQPTVEDWLQDQAEALKAVEGLRLRSERAGRFALAFAVHRADPDAPVIRQMACLQDFVAMLMWCHAPVLMLQIRAAQQADAALRSAHIQKQVLNVELEALRQALLQHWQVPDLHVRSVQLAAKLARHTEQGWDNAAVPDDIEDIAQLMNANTRVTLAYVKKVDQAQ